MVKAYKEKEATGEKDSGQNILTYLDAILKIRAYDLLWLEMCIEKVDLMAAIAEHGD